MKKTKFRLFATISDNDKIKYNQLSNMIFIILMKKTNLRQIPTLKKSKITNFSIFMKKMKIK